MSVGFQGLRQVCCVTALSLVPGMLFAGELMGIRLASGPVSTQVILDLDQATPHRVFELKDPERLVVDLPATTASDKLRMPVPKGRVRSVRTGTRPDGELRVVFDLTGDAALKSFPLAPEGGFGHRVVVELTEPVADKTPPKRTVDAYTGRDVVVVIDAGHGGHDPGTSGRRGVVEKDVTLQIAKRLATLIGDTRGFEPVLVRDSDRYVSLPDRLRIAHEAAADLFISIHADSNRDPKVHGATVYTIKTARALSETAKRLADRENGAELLGGVNLAEQSDVIARMLLEGAQNWSIEKSEAVGEHVVDRLSQVTTMLRPRAEEKSLGVLISPDIPSVLVETAFLSNPTEEARLRQATFQQTIAQALFAGIVDYCRTDCPRDSYLAHNPPPEPHGPIRHMIARGETLSEIAERYRVSLRELRRANEIKGDVIRIGQVLTIPTAF
jgi:N-acetylmuramoyl-L-alanine amidase